MGPTRDNPVLENLAPPPDRPCFAKYGTPPDGQILGPPFQRVLAQCTPMPAISPNFQKIPARTIQTKSNTSQKLSIVEILTAK